MSFPIVIENDYDYLKKLTLEFKKYLAWIGDHYNDCYDNICEITNNVIESIQLYYDSDILGATQKIKEAITENMSIKVISKIETLYNNRLFKARVIEDEDGLSHEDMLHIPFSLRNIVKSQRFSLYGTPCIYLASSSYACWLELNKPQDSTFYVSAYKIDDSLQFFDLTCATWEQLEQYVSEKRKIEEIKNELYTFPLIIATSFKVKKNNSATFHSEYIVSQLLMSIIVNSVYCFKNKIDGILYYSKKLSDDKSFFPINICVAIPAKHSENMKYTSDINCFKWTDAMCIRDYTFINWNARYDEIIFSSGSSNDEKELKKPITLLANNLSYKDTLFYDFDDYLVNKTIYKSETNKKIKD